jgi:heterodisulfide reductase subunit B
MKLPYFPGCTLKTTARNFETSALEVAQELGIELVELPRWNCCGTVRSLTNDDLIHQIAAIRNLVRVQEMNRKGILRNEYRLVTLCGICFNTLKAASVLAKNDSEKLKKINTAMDEEEEYLGGVEVIHYWELMREIGFEKISEKIKKPLRGLKVSPYYGCLLVRPREFSIDKVETPKILEEILSALDVEVIDNPYKLQCCGSYHTVGRKDLVAELAYKILSYAEMSGADAVALSCPLCAFNLDQRQEEVQKTHRNFKKIPVFYFSQLMAVAFGLDEKICGFELNHVDPKPLLEKTFGRL